MTGKDDALQQHGSVGGRTLWLRSDNMEQARDNFWQAFQQVRGRAALHDDADHRTWDISFAAAVAAISYVFEGRTEPK